MQAARRAASVGVAGGLVLCAVLVVAASGPDNPPPPGEAVGSIDGKAIAVTGPMTVETVDGQLVTMLRSGSDIRVKSGSATIKLVEGGQIAICGPAHLSVLKSGNALTIALDTGTIHAHIEHEPNLTMYTPQIQAQPVAIGDSAKDTIVGFDSAGSMCIRSLRGALRLEQQLTGQNVLVPQGGDVFLANGQIDSVHTGAGERCICELKVVEAVKTSMEISRLATTEEIHKEPQPRDIRDVKPRQPSPLDAGQPTAPVVEAQKAPQNIPKVEAIKPAAPKEEPIYQVYVPPLIFDANAKVQPEIDPKMIVLVRHVRVRPTLIFQGKVEGDVTEAKEQSSTSASNAGVAKMGTLANAPNNPAQNAQTQTSANAPQNATKPAEPDTLAQRVRTFVRKLWTGKS
jgi:hypothetical protein